MSVPAGVEQEIPRDHELAKLLAGLTAQLRSGQQPDLNALVVVCLVLWRLICRSLPR